MSAVILRSEEKCIASVSKRAFRQVLNVREVTITCLGFINPKHVAKPMTENISRVSTDYISFFRLLSYNITGCTTGKWV